MNNHPPTDHPDALLDRGLAELLGGETPPDLSDRILAAHTTPEPVTLASNTVKQTSRFKTWALLAASIVFIATVIGLLLPARNAARNPNSLHMLAQQSMERHSLEQSHEKSGIDTGIGLRGLINDAESPKTGDELIMTVTPHIIIQEEEEERLGISTEEINEETAKQSESVRFYDPTEVQALLAAKPEPNSGLYSQADKDKLEAQIKAELQRRATSAPPEAVKRYRKQEELARREQGEGQPPVPLSKMKEMVDEFNDLRDQQRYAEMEIVAKKLRDAAPENPIAQQVWENAKFIRREMVGRDLYRTSEQGIQSTSAENSWYALSDSKKKHAANGSTFEFRRRSSESDSDGETFVRVHPRLDLVLPIDATASRDQYTPIHENPFIKADGPDAVSTFSIDVDTASYANVRQYLEQSRQLPPADAVRIEELVNYFDYDYAGPTDDKPFAAHMEVAACPWNKDHRLARIAIKGKEIARDERPQSNLVFLVDVSGSMNDPNKLPLLVEGMKMLTRELGENDRVAIVVYASSEGMALPSTRGDEQETILAALDQLRAGGSTAGGAGINLAYQVALDNFIAGGTNRVILCTDGDFNVGVTDTAQLEQLAIEKAKTGVFLTVLGFGRGNLNDAMMEGISGKGNGNYHYVDNLTEARKVLVEEMAGTLITIAKDVKIQVEFNPAQVAGYRLIGYENRLLKTEDFNDDKKDAGEIGAGHTVTALYEIIPAGQEITPPAADPLKYQPQNSPPGYSGEGLGEGSSGSGEDEGFVIEGGRSGEMMGGYGFVDASPRKVSDELLTLKLRYKLPEASQSTKLEFPITDSGESFADATDDFQFAAAVASFGMLLRHSQYQGETSFDAIQEIAQASLGNDPHNYRSEFLDLVRIAKELTTNQHESHE